MSGSEERQGQDSHETKSAQGQGSRPGDNMVGRPITISSCVGQAVEWREDDVPGDEVSVEHELWQHTPIKRPRWLPVRAVNLFCVLLVALVGVYLWGEVVQVLAAVVAFPRPLQWLSVLGLGFLVVLIVVVLCKCVIGYLGFTSRSQLNLSQLRILNDSARMSATANREVREALIRQLEDRFDDNYQRVLKRQGLNDKGVVALANVVERLLNREAILDDSTWIATYLEDYQRLIDEHAKACCKRYARIVALKTAVAPWKLVDAVAVLYNSFLLLTELFELYRSRPPLTHSLYLLAHIATNTYIGSQAEAMTTSSSQMLDDAGERIADVVRESSSDNMDGPLNSVMTSFSGCIPFFKPVAEKAAEGALNYLFTYRLGRRAMAMLRPVCD